MSHVTIILRTYRMSLSPMSHVEFKKRPCRPVDFRGQGPLVYMVNTLAPAQSPTSTFDSSMPEAIQENVWWYLNSTLELMSLLVVLSCAIKCRPCSDLSTILRVGDLGRNRHAHSSGFRCKDRNRSTDDPANSRPVL